MLIKIWTDGSIAPRNPGGHAVGGWVCKGGPNLSSIARGTIDLGTKPENTNNQAEYAAVWHALTKLEEMHIKPESVIVHSDSRLVVEQLNNNWNCNVAELREYRDKIWEICNKIECLVEFKWIPREENSEADAVSRSLYVK